MGLTSASYRRESIGPDAEVGENRLPGCHRVASRLKRWLLGTHQEAVRSKHLDDYLDEFTFRFNRRTSRSRGKPGRSNPTPTPGLFVQYPNRLG